MADGLFDSDALGVLTLEEGEKCGTCMFQACVVAAKSASVNKM
jgi:hypothetical protein